MCNFFTTGNPYFSLTNFEYPAEKAGFEFSRLR